MREDPSARAARAVVYGCFVASGAAGLMLEIVWSKYLSLLLGNSVYGVATVVAAFLGGLGFGAMIGGKLADASSRPLVLYARFEAVVGLLGLASPAAFLAARPLFAALYGAMGGSGMLFLALRFVILFAVLLIPTIAMGASLPLLSAHFVRRGQAFAPSLGRLYTLNTAGAVVGVTMAGFVLIPIFGLWRTAVAASALDLIVAIAIIRLARSERDRPVSRPAVATAPQTVAAPESKVTTVAARLVLPLFALSGMCAIVYEIAWTRILSVPLGGMVYALSAILALYLLGLALGAGVGTRLIGTRTDPVWVLAILQVVLAGTVAVGAHLVGQVPDWMAALLIAASEAPARLILGELAIVAVIVLPPTLILGAIFPAAAAVRARAHGEAGAAAGMLYAANTFGSIAGSLVTGFVLVPELGALRTILAAAAINLAIGIVLALAASGSAVRRVSFAAAAAACGIVFAAALAPSWPAQKMSLGLTRLLRAYRFGEGDRGVQVLRELVATSATGTGREKLVSYEEGRLASVTVLDSPGRRALIVNGKPDATIGAGEDMMTQVSVAQIPLLMSPRAKDVCVVGYGSGVTTHAVLTHPVREVVTIEIEKAVVNAAPWFSEGAFDPLSDSRSRLVIDDAGTFLRSTPATFDVVISEPSNPWIAGIGDLFTREFYRAASARVRPGGLFCQWVQCYEVSQATLATIFRTLATCFPHGHVFYFRPSNDLVIVASPDREAPLDAATLSAVYARSAVARDLSRVGILSAGDLLRYYRGRLENLAAAAGPGPINTDDNGWLEHRAPLDLLVREERADAFGWSDRVATDLAGSLGSDPERAGRLLLDGIDRAVAGRDRASARAFAHALEILGRPEAAESWQRVASLEARLGAIKQAEQILRDTIPSVLEATQKGDAALGNRAAEALGRARELDPSSGEIAWRLGTSLIAAHRLPEAIAELNRALTLLPVAQQFPVRRDLAAARFFQVDLEGSLGEIAQMELLRPGAPEAHYWRARVLAQQGRHDEAREEAKRGLQADPENKRLQQFLASESGGVSPARE